MEDIHDIFTVFKKEFPEIYSKHEALGKEIHEKSGPLSEKTRASLEAQPIGRRLLGNTVKLVDGTFQPAELTATPDYYLVYYTASW